MENTEKERPVIGITIGDFNGIGPEIILKCLADTRILDLCIPVIYGSSKILGQYRKLLQLEQLNYNASKDIKNINKKKVNIINCWKDEYKIEPGKPTNQSGKCALTALEQASRDIKEERIDGLVTAPISKKNIRAHDFQFYGHTDYLCKTLEKEAVLMCMLSEQLKLAVATDHIPLHKVAENLTHENLKRKTGLFLESLKSDFGITKPKLAVLGLNPHAGEEGELGNEEQEVIIPVIKEFREQNEIIFGPYAADGFFGSGAFKNFDGIMAMYHDQGLTPFKLLAFNEGVNFTAGLDAIRTSPDHGTAFDIAGKNTADPASLRKAIYMACDIHKFKKGGIFV